ncbi:MAG: hypothetical protein IJ459_01890 [Clostridia bacterium]|nr:hypothetical protein [Clostridia bacterium]
MNVRREEVSLGPVLARAMNMQTVSPDAAEGLGAEREEPLLARRAKDREEGLPVGTEQVKYAERVLAEYKAQKANFDAHVVAAEEWWRMRHWNEIEGEKPRGEGEDDIEPKSAWLLSNIESKHADYMDAIPTVAVLPRELEDERAAKMLSQVLPVILEQNDFVDIYHDVTQAKVKHGTGIYHVYWDPDKLRGIGDIGMREVDCLNLFWEGGVDDIQDSENLFYVTKISRSALLDAYPELADRLRGGALSGTIEEYTSDDYVDASGKVEVVDWYYKKSGVLHLCKFAEGVVLSATENDPEAYPHGIYAHGEYPFYFDVYYSIKGSPAGFGLIDTEKSEQEFMDRTKRAMLRNVLGSSRSKTYIGESAGVNEKDVADPNVEIVKFSGSLDDSNFRTVQSSANAETYMNVMSQMVNHMKETSGNHDVTTGNAPSGVTAASAIAALQEQAGKTSRSAISDSYRVFVRVARCIIELIREFYTLPRTFRITGERGMNEYVQISRQDMANRRVTRTDGKSIEFEPIYDVAVSAQKASAYSAMAQNELALQFYNAGFFEPARADASLAVLEMMDFRDKDKMRQLINRNGTMYEMVKVLSERLRAAESLLGLQQRGGVTAKGGTAPAADAEMPEQNKEGVVAKESHVTKKARARSAETTVPR